HVVIPVHAHRGDEFRPPLSTVSVTAGAEDPGAILLVGIKLSVEHARRRQVAAVNLRVFCVYMENRIAEHPYRRDRVDALPEHVAGVVIATESLAGDRPQAQ